MSTWAEYSCLVPRPASLAGWVPVSLVWAMLVWVSRKLTWCEQLIHDYTTHESVPFTANRDISTFATEKPCFTSFKAATLSVGWEQDPVRHYMPGCCTPFSWPLLSPLCHSLCSQLVRFPLATAELHGHIQVLEVTAFLGSHQLCWPSDTQGFIWGAPCPSPLRQLSQGYRTQYLIALEGGMILSPSRFESLKVWIGDWIKFCTFFWSC